MDWITKSKQVLALLSLLLLVNSCSISYKFNGASINYDKTKTITIADFPIKSGFYVYAPLATKFNDDLKDIFIRQTRLRLAPRSGDMNIEGEIIGYQQLNKSVKADGYASETELRITINVRFVNNADHSKDFEQQFTAFRNYDSTQMLTAVQDQLITEMTKEITEQIFNATVANW
ncbi:LptE family protein [uncultured Bacteroides sp.]|uniref:LptE family protein n=1 Tax=uncultured Bacteroides sp. TaxID=162156 RepID=UPI002AAAC1B2|nr:LptE family protein [uncultured Bacteroides sp.]